MRVDEEKGYLASQTQICSLDSSRVARVPREALVQVEEELRDVGLRFTV